MNDKLDLLLEEERLLRELGNKEELAALLGAQADLLAESGQTTAAVQKLGEAEDLFRQTGNKLGIEKALYEQVRHLQDSKSPEIFEVLRRQEDFYGSVGEEEELAHCLSNQAVAFHDRGDLVNEERVLEKQIPLWKGLNNHGRLAACYGMAAMCLVRTKTELDKALLFASEAERISRKINDPERLAHALNTKTIVTATIEEGRATHAGKKPSLWSRFFTKGSQSPAQHRSVRSDPKVITDAVKARLVEDLMTIAIPLMVELPRQDTKSFSVFMQGLSEMCDKVAHRRMSKDATIMETGRILQMNQGKIELDELLNAVKRIADHLDDEQKLYLPMSLLAMIGKSPRNPRDDVSKTLIDVCCFGLGVEWNVQRGTFSIDPDGALKRTAFRLTPPPS